MAGIKFNAKWLKRDQYEKMLNEIAPTADRKLAAAEMEAGELLAKRIVGRAPRGATGNYARSIHAARLADEPAATAKNKFVKTKDPNAVGIFGEYYWRFLEFGTVKMAARPHIFPTYRAARKEIRRIVNKGLRSAVKEALGK